MSWCLVDAFDRACGHNQLLVLTEHHHHHQHHWLVTLICWLSLPKWTEWTSVTVTVMLLLKPPLIIEIAYMMSCRFCQYPCHWGNSGQNLQSGQFSQLSKLPLISYLVWPNCRSLCWCCCLCICRLSHSAIWRLPFSSSFYCLPLFITGSYPALCRSFSTFLPPHCSVTFLSPGVYLFHLHFNSTYH